MPSARLKQLLDEHHIRYVSVVHSLAYTAQEIAALVHVPGRAMAKSVVVLLDDALALAVIPASLQVDLTALKKLAGAAKIELASERDFRTAFPDCETGAMPPFGTLYGLPTYVDERLRGDEICFNAGSHRELLRLPWADFERLEAPILGNIATTIRHAAA